MRHEESLGQRLRDARAELRELETEATGIAGGMGRVARDEARLAVAEVRDGVRSTIQASIWAGIALALGAITLAWLPLPIVVGLAEAMPLWAAALITVGLLLALTALAWFLALRRFKAISFVPKQAIERVKEDAEWLRQQFSGGHS